VFNYGKVRTLVKLPKMVTVVKQSIQIGDQLLHECVIESDVISARAKLYATTLTAASFASASEVRKFAILERLMLRN
jgi:hypothetical protein